MKYKKKIKYKILFHTFSVNISNILEIFTVMESLIKNSNFKIKRKIYKITICNIF